MTNSKMREEFEVWARKNSMDLEYRNIPNVGQFYQCLRTLLAFEAWQAARDALVIELPDDAYLNRESVFVQGYIEGVRLTKEAIQAAGVKVKS